MLLGGVDGEQRAQFGDDPHGGRRAGIDRRAFGPGARIGVDPSPRIEDPYHRTLDPAGELSLDPGDDRRRRLGQQAEAARFVASRRGHPSMTSPSMVFTEQPTSSR